MNFFLIFFCLLKVELVSSPFPNLRFQFSIAKCICVGEELKLNFLPAKLKGFRLIKCYFWAEVIDTENCRQSWEFFDLANDIRFRLFKEVNI